MFGEDPLNPEKLNDELRLYYEEEGGSMGWPMLRHPLVYQIPFMSWKNANEMYDAKHEAIDKRISEGNYEGALWFFERPYRLTQLQSWYWLNLISLEQLKKILPDVWLDTEHPHQFGYPSIVKLFKETGFLTDIPGLREPVECEVFRGCLSAHKRGISWTLDKSRAEWFAKRLNRGKGRVYRTIVNPKAQLAAFNGRGEQEILVNPRALKDLEEMPFETL